MVALQSTTLLNIALSFGLSLFVVIYFAASFSDECLGSHF